MRQGLQEQHRPTLDSHPVAEAVIAAHLHPGHRPHQWTQQPRRLLGDGGTLRKAEEPFTRDARCIVPRREDAVIYWDARVIKSEHPHLIISSVPTMEHRWQALG